MTLPPLLLRTALSETDAKVLSDWAADAADAITKLRAERDDAIRHLADWSNRCGQTEAERDALAALRSYAKHDSTCPIWGATDDEQCNCGLSNILRLVDKMKNMQGSQVDKSPELQGQPRDPGVSNLDEVICPNCCCQFRAIPENIQDEISALRAERDALAALLNEAQGFIPTDTGWDYTTDAGGYLYDRIDAALAKDRS